MKEIVYDFNKLPLSRKVLLVAQFSTIVYAVSYYVYIGLTFGVW